MTNHALTSRLSSVSLLLSSLMVFGVLAQGRMGNQAPAQLQIGVVDVAKVLENYAKAVQEQKRLEDGRKEIFDWYNAELVKLKELQVDVDGDGGRHKDYNQLNLDTRKANLRGLRELRNADWQDECAKYVAWASDDVDAAVDQIAKTRNLLLVVKAQNRPSDKEAISRRAMTYDGRVVWFASEQIDITADVIKLLQVRPPDAGKATPASPGPRSGNDGKADSKGNGKQ
jgi:Skp family chaperone for outer membrane proteins